MKIAYVAHSPVPSSSANSIHVMKMAQALAKIGHDVVLYSPEYKRQVKFDPGDVFSYYGVEEIFQHRKVPYLKAPLIQNYSHYIILACLLLPSGFDLIFTRDVAVALIAAKLGLPAIFEWHDSFEQKSKKAKIFKALIKEKQFKGLVVVSESLKQEMIKSFALHEDMVTVAHDGADLFPDMIDHVFPETNNNIFRIGYTGHLYQGRGIDVIGKTARLHPTFEFHIVGGLKKDVQYWRGIFSDCTNITFHGLVPPAKIPSYLNDFDVLLAPYQEKVSISGGEGDTSRWMSPLKIFEYMASGKPVICSDIPVLKEVLQDNKNCLLCPPEDEIEWGKRIIFLRDNPDVAVYLAKTALQEFKQKYTWLARSKFILAERIDHA